jgi:hypothetical protein
VSFCQVHQGVGLSVGCCSARHIRGKAVRWALLGGSGRGLSGELLGTSGCRAVSGLLLS